MKRIFTHLFVAVLLMLSTTSWAQVQSGKVYNFVNREYGKSMSCVERDRAVLATTDNDDYSQLWYVADGGDGTYTLRNLGNGYYLKGNGSGSKWPFVADASVAKLYYRELSSDYCTFDADNSDNGNEMHYGYGNGCVVGWSSSESASQWTATLVDVSESDLAANWAAIDAIDNASSHLNDYSVLLENMFEDASCTVLKSPYGGYSDSQFNDDGNYSNLPAVLQAMVKKVRYSSWGEENVVGGKPAWDSDHSKRFRVQLYEPYSYAERTANMLGISAHTNMNNPTGIVANARDVLYVMVEGDVPEGAALYIQAAVDRERIGNVGGVQLQKGLNIIPYWGDDNQIFIHYVVDTYNNGAKTGYELTDYAPLKIHIEGGCINGCFDTVGDALNAADTEDDWNYYEERASQYNFTVMGKYVMWHMPLNLADEPYDSNGYKTYDLSVCLGSGATSVFDAMATWEALESAQRLAEGLLSADEIAKIRYASGVFEYTGNDEFYPSDYSKVFNNRSLAYSTVNEYYMFAGDKATHYAAYTLKDVIRDIPTSADPWGPSHEIGHTYQGPIQLPSTSETSNNALANISNYFMSRTSSRLGSMQELLAQFNNKTSYLGVDANSSNVWDKLMMYTKLWLYYHVAGNNKKFYPRLCEMFRRDPIERTSTVTGTGTMLKFYKYACMAAEEDLTDFFAAFGFFVPVDGVHSDDYAQYKTIMTQAEIDAAKAEVAAMAKANGWKKNTTILFIDDRIGDVVGADGKTVLAPRSDGGKEQGVLGSINDYDQNPGNDVAPLNGTYSYSITGSTMTMSGATGGTGFVIYDADGNLVSFSNTYSFPLSEEAQAALATGKAKVVVVKSDNSIVEIEDADATQTQINLLQGLLRDVEELLSFEDPTETKVGYFKSSALTALKEAYNKASEVYNGTNLAAYSGVYNLLYEEFNNVVASKAAKVWFRDDRTYSLKNVQSGTYMKNDGTNVKADNTSPTASSASYLWHLQEGNYYQYYKVKNSSTGQFVQHHGNNNNNVIYTLGNAEKEFEIKEVSYGKFTIYEQGHKRYLNYQSGDVKTWEGNGTGSQWEITFIPTDETMAERAVLEDLMLQAQLLVDEVSNSEVVYEELPLQVTEPNAEYYLWTNAQDPYEGDIEYLIDNETGDTGDKFFHSDYHNSSKPAGYHYLEVYLGADNTNSVFKFAYTNRNNGSNHPDGIAVKVSNTKDDYQNGTTVYEVLSGLPQGQGKSWTSDVFATGEAYKYLHFKITADNTFWHMDEFDIYTPVVSIELFNNYSAIGEGVVRDVVNTMMNNTILLGKNDLTSQQLKDAYDVLLEDYETLLNAKSDVDNGVADAKKEELQSLIDATNELIAQVGEATVIADANVDLLGKLYAEKPYTGNTQSDCSSAENGYNLLDGDVNTHFHSDYNTSTMVSPPYLRVDLGEGNSTKKFKFNYTTRNQGGCAPTKINVYGGVAGVAGVEYSQGAIQSSAALNAITTPTKIVIKNLSGTNSLYFAGESNVAEFNAAVLVWEPVEVGVAGRYYLRTTDAENGYIQEGSGAVQLGTIDKAQKFFTTAPSASIAESQDDKLHFTGESLVDGTDTGKLVRFVQDGKSTWLNVNSAGALPRLGNSGNGGWTVHNVYLVTETENAPPSYDATPIATFTTGDASNPLPTGTSAKWTSADIASTKDCRFFKFEVAESQGRNDGGYYFAISEFGFNIVDEYSATINPEYQGIVTEELLIETRQEVDAAVIMKKIATSEELLQAQIDKLQAAKDALKEAMNSTSALKAQLSELLYQAQTLYVKIADENDEVIDDYYKSAIGQEDFGTFINEISEAGPLVEENANPTATDLQTAISELGAICEKINGIIAADFAQDSRTAIQELVAKMETLFGEVADKTTAKTVLALQTTDKDDSFYIWSNATAWDCNGIGALIDKNDDGTAKTGTFFGTTWDGGAVNSYDHYIAVDLGVDVAISELSLDYTTRDSDHSNQRPTAIKVLGSNDKEGGYVEITHLSEGMPVGQCAKWEMSSAVALNSYYRYIRFAVATDAGFFNMSDFNLYAHSAVETKDDYLPSGIIGEQLFAMNAALLAGIDAREKFVTEENYNAALTVLQEQYKELLAIKNANVSDRNSLANLITETNTLLAEVAKIDGTEAKIALQCDDENAPYYIYCNAPGATNNYGGDNLGVAALLDVDENGQPINSTHLHTTYTGNSFDDEFDHYLRVDMGESNALEAFKFAYIPRSGNTNNAPKVMLIEGSNDCVNFEEIATLTDMQPTYQSDEITNGKAYRYIRFMVKETHTNDKYNGHPFFVLSHFEMTACKTIKVAQGVASPNLPLSTVVVARNELVDGTTVNEQFYVTLDLYDSTVAELQAAKDALEAAIALKDIPVKLTTDVKNPVLYKIYINRTHPKTVLQYDEVTAMVAVANIEIQSANAQSWYFMQGTDTGSNDDILILPYIGSGSPNTTLRLAANETGNAAEAVKAVAADHDTYRKQNWYVTFKDGNTAEGWWNIQPEGKGNYFSNNGGVGNKMGFWNSASDDGSEFRFIPDNAHSIIAEGFGSFHREPEYAGVPGYLKNPADYNNAYDALDNILKNNSGTEDECIAAYNQLLQKVEALKASTTDYTASDGLVDGGVYRIMNLITKTETQCKYHYIANNNAEISFPVAPANDGTDLWVCIKDVDNEKYKFVSALGTLSLGWKKGDEDAQAYTVADGNVSGAKRLKNGNTAMALTNEKWGKLDFDQAGSDGNTQSPNWSTDWFFQKVENVDVAFNVNISSRRFSSLYLPYNVTVPAGVSAYTAVAVDGGYVDLHCVADNDDETAAGEIIPARTPVILYLEGEQPVAGTYKFTYVPDAVTLSDDIAGCVNDAIIFGKILQTPIECDADARYYKLGSKSGDTVSKMYWMYKEYGEDGTITHPNSDNGGYIRCSANKIYMRVMDSGAQNVFSMRFAGATTGIDEVNGENGEVKAIYDMQGRKLTEITMPGVYIVNGKKVVVK